MKYRWKKHGEEGYDEAYTLNLILDDGKYELGDVTWYTDIERWHVFVSGYVSEDHADVERNYELLCDAKKELLNYMRVWWVSGAFQRMNDSEKYVWRE